MPIASRSRVAVLASLAVAVALTSGCSWFRKDNDAYKLSGEARPLEIPQAQGKLDFRVVMAELAEAHGQVEHADVEKQSEKRVERIERCVNAPDQRHRQQHGQAPGQYAMPESTGIEAGFDEIRPGPQRLGNDATVIERLQLLDEEDCDQRQKTHGGRDLPYSANFLISKYHDTTAQAARRSPSRSVSERIMPAVAPQMK